MSKPIEESIQYQFPRGTLVTWTDIGDAVSLRYVHEPTVLISGSIIEGIAFEGSLDGKKFELIRDQDGDVISYRKPGIYTVPAKVRAIKPANGANFVGTIQLFIEE